MKKGDISLEYVGAALILLALLIVVLIFTGILRFHLSAFMQKLMDLVAGR